MTVGDSAKSDFQRLFIAVSLPAGVKSEIHKIQKDLARILPEGAVRWPRSEHLHLTLRFLGNVAISRTQALVEKLNGACREFTPLQLSAQRIGFFPERGFPRVIWTAVDDKTQQLARLQSAIQAATLEFSFEPPEKEFTGHITIGRAKKVRRREAEALSSFAAKMGARVFGEWESASIELFGSELLSDGARHTLIAAIPLDSTPNPVR